MSNMVDSPAWSFGGKPKSKSSLKDNPGPGSYEVRGKTVSVSGFPESKSARFFELLAENVGPGSYDPKLPSNNIGGAQDRSLRPDLSNKNYNPGPGTYEIQFNSSSGFSFQSKGKVKESAQNPGPGAYTLSFYNFKHSPSYSLKSRPATARTIQGPGPGAYKPPTPREKRTPSKTKAKRFSGYSTDAPGPGTYNPRDKSQEKGGNIFIGTSKKPQPKNEGPGPAQFFIESPCGKDKGFSMSGRYRNSSANTVPGPGTYEPRDKSKQKGGTIFFGTSSKPQPKNEGPGPAQFLLESPNAKGKGFSMYGRHRIKNTNGVPGPGAYNPKKTNKNNGNTVILKSRRASLGDEASKKAVPGPGLYNPKKKPGIAYSFGSSHRRSFTTSDVPGPGQYHHTSTIGNRELLRRQLISN